MEIPECLDLPSAKPSEDPQPNVENVAPVPPPPYRWRKRDIQPLETAFQHANIEPEPIIDETPYEFFVKFITKEMLETVALQTNLYSMQQEGDNINTSPKEIEQLIGCLFRMGLVKMPNQRSYWEGHMSYNGLSTTFSRNCCEKLMRSIHFVDNLNISEEEKKDRVWKLRPWLSCLRGQFLLVSPEEYQAVDEIMVPFKGKSFLKQYMPNKPHKWGFKMWGRSGISGFLYDFDLYQGRSQTKEKTEFGICAGIVLKLTFTLPKHCNFKVFADNFFTTLPLIEKLKSDGFLYVGTVRVPRLKDCPVMSEKDLKKQERGACDYRTCQERNIIVVKWFDNKGVNLASSWCGVEPQDEVKRYDRKDKNHVLVKRPRIVNIYITSIWVE